LSDRCLGAFLCPSLLSFLMPVFDNIQHLDFPSIPSCLSFLPYPMPPGGKSGSKGSSRQVNAPYLCQSKTNGAGSSKAVFHSLGSQAFSTACVEAEKTCAAVQHCTSFFDHHSLNYISITIHKS
jgi:hypothetical protein